ncbi:MAG: phage portal protein [Defluviitaleaceae bacterium]|nr:phage portal protein [Defluviitaleaceae bacterium]
MIQKKKDFFENLDDKAVMGLLQQIQPYLTNREKLYKRYRRKPHPAQFMSGIDSRTLVGFEHYIVNMAKGYLAGKSPLYSFDETSETYTEEYAEMVDTIKRVNDDSSVFAELIHSFISTGAAYLYISADENNNINYTPISGRGAIAIYDYAIRPRMTALLRTWQEDKEQIMEITTATSQRRYNSKGESISFEDYDENGVLRELHEKQLYWGAVPAVAFEQPDGIAIFEPAIDLIDVYENMLTNARNMTQYNDAAKIIIRNHNAHPNKYIIDPQTGEQTINPAWHQEIKEIYEAPAIFFPNEGDAQWLIKQVDYNGLISFLKQLEELIFMTTSVPNMADKQFAGNTSGVALRYKMYALDQYVTTLDRIFKKGYRRLWEIITDRINLRNSTDYSSTDILISFDTNAPDDRDGDMARAINAKKNGLLSHQTAIEISGVEVDPITEIERINSESRVESEQG